MKAERLLPFILLLLTAAVIAVATLIEDAQGTTVARQMIYGAAWFKLLWGTVAFTSVWLIYRFELWRRMNVFLLHVSFVVILVGALLTAFTGRKGMLHLRTGVPTQEYLSDDNRVERMPFLVRLDSFTVQHYPGTQTPQDYVSLITCQDQVYRISMNHIAQVEGYRFYQSSYDPDLQGSTLSVNYDPWGTTLTYTGYALLAISIISLLLRRAFCRWKGRFLKASCLLALLATCLPAQAVESALSRAQADSMDHGQVIWNDRVAPLGTMTHDFLLKLYGKSRYQGLTGTQVMAGWMMDPARWSEEPIIKIKDKTLRQQLGIKGKYASLHDFFDGEQQYKLSTLSPTRAVQEADEKVGLALMLLHGTLIQPVPKDVNRLSNTMVSLELCYNRVDWTLWGMVGGLVLALLAFVGQWKTTRRVGLDDTSRWPGRHVALANMTLCLFLLVALLLRWAIAGHLPMSNGYETMLFVAWVVTAITLFIPTLRGIGGLCCFFLLLVAHLGEINPQITQLMPVLHSPWLSAHVSVIMISYAMLALSIADRRLLEPAVLLLAAGIFLGAVWANVSWGTYWSWDPKESWALVTLIVYSIPLHPSCLPWLRSTRNYRIYSLLALACLLMTYFGVNYLLGGMHSYAG